MRSPGQIGVRWTSLTGVCLQRSWSSDDLRIKYRNETSREAVWIASKAAEAAAEKLRLTEGIIVPYVKVRSGEINLSVTVMIASDLLLGTGGPPPAVRDLLQPRPRGVPQGH
jgi:hypothetical protein